MDQGVEQQDSVHPRLSFNLLYYNLARLDISSQLATIISYLQKTEKKLSSLSLIPRSNKMQNIEVKQLELHFKTDQHVTEPKTKNLTSSQLGKLVIATRQNADREISKPLTREKEM